MAKNAVVIEGVRYDSATDAARKLNLPYSRVMSRLKSEDWPEWVFKGDYRPIIIDGVEYQSPQDAADALNISLYKVRQRLLEVGNGEIVKDIPYEKSANPHKRAAKLKVGSKPVSINGVCFPTISSARFYNARHGDGTCTRSVLVSRLLSDNPKWADWKFITEAELPEQIPYNLTGYRLLDDVDCFIHQYAFLVVCYTNDPMNVRQEMIPGVTIDAKPCRGKNTLSVKLNDGTYLNISSDQLPLPDTADYIELSISLAKYLARKQASK